MSRSRLHTSAVLVGLGAVVAACSEPQTPASVTVVPGTVTLDAVGASRQLAAVVKNQKGTELTGVGITWTSSADAVVSVTGAGQITALAKGTAQITAAAGAVTGTAAVTVTQTPSQIELVSGNQQTGVVNQALAQQLSLRVRDRLGNGIAGLTVNFAVGTDGGMVSPASSTTDAQGQAATTWTFGTKAGLYQVVAALGSGEQLLTFSGRANPAPASILSKVTGDNQFAFQGTRLDSLLAVRVRDQFGNGVGGHQVQFVTDPGNGTADSSVAFTDSTGVARSGWVMPLAIANVSLRAQATGTGGAALTGSPQTFNAVSHNLRVTSASPSPLVEGAAATLTGSGFDLTPGNNAVTVDGLAAAVTGATSTTLTITVPTSDCKPSRNVEIRVTAAGIPSAPKADSVRPAAFVSLAVGQQQIIQDPSAFCLQFARTSAQESYLVGVQSTSESASDLTPIALTALVGSAPAAVVAAAPAARAAQAPLTRVSPWDAARLRRWTRHRAVELQQRESDRLTFETFRGRGAAGARALAPLVLVDANRVPGDTIKSVRIVGASGCATGFTEITTVIRAKGTRAFFLDDVANPAGGFSTAHFEQFSQQFDTQIYPALQAEFGTEGDDDGNGRLVIVSTQEVNRRGSLGFTTSCDLFERDSTNLRASNDGEFFYMIAADPTGSVNNDTLELADALGFMPSILAHEPVHVIQHTRRQAAGAGLFPSWLAEGQAVLGEEIVGHAVEGRSTGTNLELAVVLNLDDTTSTDWYSGHIVALALYFGWDPITNTANPDGRVENAPHECSWLASKPTNAANWPCVGGLDPYGASWSLLRWLSDRFGPSYAGGEPGFQQALLTMTQNGYALLQAVTGVNTDSLLAQWAAMLFVDDRVAGISPALTMTSWDLFDIFYGTTQGLVLRPALRLTPVGVTYANFTRNANVRGGSNYYAIISGSNRPATALKARDGVGQLLAPHMQYWIVRIE